MVGMYLVPRSEEDSKNLFCDRVLGSRKTR
ncbi:hypothetical protein A2U01_0091332, partial [Trifolium medium]|nr:hypothetical protein [Trifolium medium]